MTVNTQQNLNNAEVFIYSQLAKSAYNNFGLSQVDIGKTLDEVPLSDIYDVITALPHTTSDGFQAVLYGKANTYNSTTGKYGEIVIAYRGSMPPEERDAFEFWDDWIQNDFKDIVGGDVPRQMISADIFYRM